jgi:carboxypeptidase PM20D1
MKKFAVALGLALCVLVAVLVGRTWRLTGSSTAPAAAVKADLNASLLAGRLAKALQIQTIAHEPPEPNELIPFQALHELMRSSFPRTFSALKTEVIAGGSLLMTWQGSDPSLPPVLLLSHQDVVPVSPGTEGDWLHPAFSGVIDQGFIWGRGTLDDKSGVFGLLEAVEHLLLQGVKPRRSVILAFGHDEEVGGSGAKAMATLLADRGTRAEYILDEGGMVGEGIISGIARPAALVGVTEKGVVSIELTAQDPGGHSSMPPRTTNIGRLARAITRLEANQEPLRIGSTLAESLQALAPAMGFGRRLAVANLWLFSPVISKMLATSDSTRAGMHTTLAPTIFQAGIKNNVLPGIAKAVVNLRLIPGDSIAKAMQRVEAAIDDPEVKIRTLAHGREPAPESDPKAGSFIALSDTIQQVFPDAIVAPFSTVAATDAAHYAAISPNVYRFLPVRWGAEDQKRFHGTNERISVEGYADAVRFYIQLISNTAG